MAGDNSCVGVAGFEVIVSPTGQSEPPVQRVGPTTIVDPSACALPLPVSVPNLNIDAPVNVIVRGYDGTGAGLRVNGSQTLQNLRDKPVHLVLKAASQQLPPLLVFYRNPWLEGVPISEITSMAIGTQMGMTNLLTVNRMTAGDYLNPEPGAYGIPAGLTGGLAAKGMVITVNFTAKAGQMIRQARLTIVDWNGTYYTAQ
jgi:hypothetical protein